MDEVIAIAMTAHNDVAYLRRSIDSFLSQRGCLRSLLLVVSLDSSTDGSEAVIRSYLPDDRIVLLKADFESAYQNRNFILQYVRTQVTKCVLVGRLDADDELCGNDVLAAVEAIYDRVQPDGIVLGNQQRKDGVVSSFVNRPDASLMNPERLIERLGRMASGDWQAELPSCNTFFRSSVNLNYRPVSSAEDHWLLVELLLQTQRYKIHIDADLLYCIYSIGGKQTTDNQKGADYLEARRKLLEYAQSIVGDGK